MCDSTLSIPASLETLPCLEPYPGDFNFQLQLPADNSTHKWTVCIELLFSLLIIYCEH